MPECVISQYGKKYCRPQEDKELYQAKCGASFEQRDNLTVVSISDAKQDGLRPCRNCYPVFEDPRCPFCHSNQTGAFTEGSKTHEYEWKCVMCDRHFNTNE